MNRRLFLGQSAALFGTSVGINKLALASSTTKAQVVIVGAGYGGATAAKYIRMLSNNSIAVTLIEPNADFISCPLSNLVVGGEEKIGALTTSYNGLPDKYGVNMIKDMVTAVDTGKKTVTTAGGNTVAYDKLILAPGITMNMASIEGLAQANADGVTLQAWKAGPETVALHQQIADMPDGGIVALTIPLAPYRCPPGPYERTCQIANYLKNNKPKSKIVVFDSNDDVTSKGKLFKQAWADMYEGYIDYRPAHKVVAVDGKTRTLKFEFEDDFKADVLNVIPTMGAGSLVVDSGIANMNNRWAEVDFLNFESTQAKDVHVIGDSIQVAPGMPKSGHMANQHAKVAAAAIVAELNDFPVNPQPVVTNTCYSFVNDRDVVHVASVHQYNPEQKTFLSVKGAGGLSPEPSQIEGIYAWGWAKNIWFDTVG
jgi:NADPH-dependent 2,4-dienoyl-CoA reductase/sulfur reductase-like enzyme